jgi:hypothetical protein
MAVWCGACQPAHPTTGSSSIALHFQERTQDQFQCKPAGLNPVNHAALIRPVHARAPGDVVVDVGSVEPHRPCCAVVERRPVCKHVGARAAAQVRVAADRPELGVDDRLHVPCRVPLEQDIPLHDIRWYAMIVAQQCAALGALEVGGGTKQPPVQLDSTCAFTTTMQRKGSQGRPAGRTRRGCESKLHCRMVEACGGVPCPTRLKISTPTIPAAPYELWLPQSTLLLLHRLPEPTASTSTCACFA